MHITLDGTKIRDVGSFLDELSRALGSGDPSAYFGWELHSLNDCLQGGFLGEPPYDVQVANAEPMVLAFGHKGWSRYCAEMIRVIDEGGRGLVQNDSREWYVEEKRAADRGEGSTLLDALFEVFQCGTSTLNLTSTEEAKLSLGSSESEE